MGAEATVSEHEHARAKRLREVPGQGGLPGGAGPHGRPEHGMGAALGQGHHPQLGERTLAGSPPRARLGERSGILGRVGHVQGGPVHAH